MFETWLKLRNKRKLQDFWQDAATRATQTPLGLLAKETREARVMQKQLNDFLYIADNRLAYPRIGASKFKKPADADWGWRPEIWRGQIAIAGHASVESKTWLGSEVALFHDCGYSEISMRQLRNHKPDDLAPYGLRLDVLNFQGSYLSLSVNLEDDAWKNIRRTHLFEVALIVELESNIEIYCRLNLKHGPNTEQIVHLLALNENTAQVAFDLGFLEFNQHRVERIWIDFIFDNPRMNQMTIRDITMTRRTRSDF